MIKIRLVKPSLIMENEILNFKEEFINFGEKTINGGELLDKFDSIPEWLEYVKDNSSILTVRDGWVLTDTFLAYENGRIVGIISLHYELNDFLKMFGHIGYSVRPTERRKGHATRMLNMLLETSKENSMKEVIISTKEDNIASRKTVLKNGGVLQKVVRYLDYNVCIYQICLKD